MSARDFKKIWRNEMPIPFLLQDNIRSSFNENNEKELTLEGIYIDEDIKLADETSTFCNLVLWDCLLWNITFTNLKVQSISFKHKSQSGAFTISNCKIAEISIHDNCSTGAFIIDKSTLGEIYMSYSKTPVLYVKNSSIIASVRIWHSNIQKIQVWGFSNIALFRCHLGLHIPTQITLKNSDFVQIDFDDTVFPEFTTLNISECRINKLTIRNFRNYGTAFFCNLTPLWFWNEFGRDENESIIFNDGNFYFEKRTNQESTLSFIDSDLGRVQFINCDLQLYHHFEYSNTRMLDVFVAGSEMPDSESFRLQDEKSLKIAFSQKELEKRKAPQKRLAYGQFKKIYENQGDIASSLRYLAHEMNAYLDELDLNSKNWYDHFGERLMLRLNRWSTNYGNSWWLGVQKTFVAVLIGYLFYCGSLGFRPGYDFATAVNLASYGFQYVNPFSDPVIPKELLPNVPESDFWTTWMLPTFRVLDYITRFLVAYFAYQTIQAFRKLGKSSG